MATKDTLLSNALMPLPLDSVKPTGWLAKQLQIQAEGLSGHLDEFWPDIARSAWIGGDAEGWERAPYWLDGLVPLAFLLDDEKLKRKVRRWLDYILDHQREDGWFGPVLDAKYGYEYDPWPVFVLLKTLTQYYEVQSDARIIPAMLRFLRHLQGQLVEIPLKSWAKMRGADLILSIYWLYRRTDEHWLLDLARTVQEQTYDWRAHFERFLYTEKQPQWLLENHVVNHAMALKQQALWYQLSHDERELQSVKHAIAILDAYHGQATGVFSGDESLAGKNPSQGTELCAVVEYLFSLETLIAASGDVDFADRLERIAYNALPATFKPDMWAHQYVQQANQVACVLSEDRLYTNNGPDANLYGLEPNFGCCTANMHQGWPKFAAHLWMGSADGGLAAITYAPCRLTISIAGVPVHVEVRTTYPFEDNVHIDISCAQPVKFPLHLRIPGWCEQATVAHEGEQHIVQPGSFYRVEREWHGTTTLRLHLPAPLKTQTRYHNSVSLERGPLVYALKIGETWQQLRGELPHADWEVRPSSPWNYALQIDREHPDHSCSLVQNTVNEETPFAPDQAPLLLRVTGRRIPEWQIEHNASGLLPVSPVASTEPLTEVVLIPYGCTNLRVTEFPMLPQDNE